MILEQCVPLITNVSLPLFQENGRRKLGADGEINLKIRTPMNGRLDVHIFLKRCQWKSQD